MAKTLFVRDLTVGQTVDAVFFIADKQRAAGKRPHRCLLRDRTGDVSAICWPNTPRVDWAAAEAASYARVVGTVEYNAFSKAPQVIIEGLEPLPAPDDLTDYVPCGPTDTQALWDRFCSLATSVQEPTLRAVLQHFRDDAAFCLAFRNGPGAKRRHHAYCGGLLEHSLEVATLAEALVRPLRLNRDLVVTAALLHDVGKLDELDYSSPAFQHTPAGGFMGHVYLGAERVRRALRAVRAEGVLMGELLCHLILSHHERAEWGAPVQPAVMEAFALAACDNLSARKFYLDQAAGGARSEAFIYDRNLEGWVFTGDYPRGTEEEEEREEVPEAPPPAPLYVREEPPCILLPLLGQIVAGVPVEEQQHIEEWLAVPAGGGARPDDFLLRVHGDSMRDAHIIDGDLVRVRPTTTARDGDIVVALVDGESTVKYLAHRKGRPILKPANPAYKPVTPSERFEIQGVVVGVMRG